MTAVNGITVEEVRDPESLALHRRQRDRFDQNVAWFRQHASGIYRNHRGRCIAVAGEELFVADTPDQARAQAKAAHPDDDGAFVRYIPQERMPRVYAGSR